MSETADLLEENAALKAMLIASEARNLRKDERIERLEKLVAAFRQAVFGRRSEKSDPDQFELALEDLETAEPTLWLGKVKLLGRRCLLPECFLHERKHLRPEILFLLEVRNPCLQRGVLRIRLRQPFLAFELSMVEVSDLRRHVIDLQQKVADLCAPIAEIDVLGRHLLSGHRPEALKLVAEVEQHRGLDHCADLPHRDPAFAGQCRDQPLPALPTPVLDETLYLFVEALRVDALRHTEP